MPLDASTAAPSSASAATGLWSTCGLRAAARPPATAASTQQDRGRRQRRRGRRRRQRRQHRRQPAPAAAGRPRGRQPSAPSRPPAQAASAEQRASAGRATVRRGLPAGTSHRDERRELASVASPIPSTSSSSSTAVKPPLSSRQARIACAVTGTDLGQRLELGSVGGVEVDQRPPGLPARRRGAAGAAAPAGAGTPTRICSPSTSSRARLSPDRSTPGRAPPAASSASTTRAPASRTAMPGRRTLPGDVDRDRLPAAGPTARRGRRAGPVAAAPGRRPAATAGTGRRPARTTGATGARRRCARPTSR